jgi:hypothetical protein
MVRPLSREFYEGLFGASYTFECPRPQCAFKTDDAFQAVVHSLSPIHNLRCRYCQSVVAGPHAALEDHMAQCNERCHANDGNGPSGARMVCTWVPTANASADQVAEERRIHQQYHEQQRLAQESVRVLQQTASLMHGMRCDSVILYQLQDFTRGLYHLAQAASKLDIHAMGHLGRTITRRARVAPADAA